MQPALQQNVIKQLNYKKSYQLQIPM